MKYCNVRPFCPPLHCRPDRLHGSTLCEDMQLSTYGTQDYRPQVSLLISIWSERIICTIWKTQNPFISDLTLCSADGGVSQACKCRGISLYYEHNTVIYVYVLTLFRCLRCRCLCLAKWRGQDWVPVLATLGWTTAPLLAATRELDLPMTPLLLAEWCATIRIETTHLVLWSALFVAIPRATCIFILWAWDLGIS